MKSNHSKDEKLTAFLQSYHPEAPKPRAGEEARIWEQIQKGTPKGRIITFPKLSKWFAPSLAAAAALFGVLLFYSMQKEQEVSKEVEFAQVGSFIQNTYDYVYNEEELDNGLMDETQDWIALAQVVSASNF